MLSRLFVCLLALNLCWVCAYAVSGSRPRIPRSYQRLSQPLVTVPQLSLWLEGTTQSDALAAMDVASVATLDTRPSLIFTLWSFAQPVSYEINFVAPQSSCRAPPQQA